MLDDRCSRQQILLQLATSLGFIKARFNATATGGGLRFAVIDLPILKFLCQFLIVGYSKLSKSV